MTEHVHDRGEAQVLHPTLTPFCEGEAQVLCFSLVVKCEDVVSSACLALSDQKHSMSLGSRALNQVGCFDAGDGPVEPGVGEQEVISLLDNLLWQGKGDGGLTPKL